jgi:hypothetical protein
MNWVADARTLGEASSGRSVMRSFVVAAIEGIRLSPGFDSEGGIKERVAASFSEYGRSEARRVRFGMVCSPRLPPPPRLSACLARSGAS